MTSPIQQQKASAARSSSSTPLLELEVHIFECGQGDTILARICDRWIMVDCFLPPAIRPRFFRFIETLEISRLDLLCLTHSHRDHYTGMVDVLKHFTSEGRELVYFCDSGVDPKQIVTLLDRRLEPDEAVTEFEDLYELVNQLQDTGKIRCINVDENTRDLSELPSISVHDSVQILPLGPTTGAVRRAVRETIADGIIRADLNTISVVLAIAVRGLNSHFHAILAADTDAEGFNTAVDRLAERLGVSTPPAFDLIKVSHHGSLLTHEGSRVCALRHSERESIAAISAGTGLKHPDREVIKQFIESGWTVLTTTRRNSAPSSQPIELFGRRGTPPYVCRDIRIAWNAERGIAWGPADCKIEPQELPAYGTAHK